MEVQIKASGVRTGSGELTGMALTSDQGVRAAGVRAPTQMSSESATGLRGRGQQGGGRGDDAGTAT